MTFARPDQSQRVTPIYFRGTIRWTHFNAIPALGVKKGPSDSYSHGVRAKIAALFGNDTDFSINDGSTPTYHVELLRAKFCLCPLGFATWSGRMFDVIMMGCIPVIISDNIQVLFSVLPLVC